MAVDFALAYPDRVRSLTLLAAAARDHDWSARARAYGQAEESALEAGDLDRAVAVNVATWLDGWDTAALEAIDEPLRIALHNQAKGEEFDQGGPEWNLASITVPVVVGIGDRDLSDFEMIAARYAARIPGARLVEFPGAGHLIPVEQPQAVLAALPF